LFGGEGNETHGSISARRRGSWHRHLGRFPPPPAYLPPRMGTLMMRPLRVGRSYKGSANCTLDSLRFAISTYSGLISIPTACRPRRSATSKVVPLPAKGSRTMHLPEPSLPSQVQVGSKPRSIRSLQVRPFVLNRLDALTRRISAAGLEPPWITASPRNSPFSTTRLHGAPHFGHALGDDPARIHSSGNFSGNVAKWASGYGCVAMVQTERLFRVAFSSLTVCDTATSGASFRL